MAYIGAKPPRVEPSVEWFTFRFLRYVYFPSVMFSFVLLLRATLLSTIPGSLVQNAPMTEP